MTQRVRTALSSHRLAVPLALAAAAAGFVILLVVARSPSSKGHEQPAARRPTVEVRRSKLGRILVDARGRTLYLFLEDARGRSSCFAACARVWPPALVTGRPRPGAGVDPAKLTMTRRRHARRRQVVYNGHPLYTADADTRPGQTEGQAFLGTWFVVSPAGRQIGKASAGGGY